MAASIEGRLSVLMSPTGCIYTITQKAIKSYVSIVTLGVIIMVVYVPTKPKHDSLRLPR